MTLEALLFALLFAPSATNVAPLRDPIPVAMRGIYGRTAASCNDPREIAFLKVTANRLAYYEADEFLLLGIAFEGTSPTGHAQPMLNGRFIARQETTIAGEGNLRLVLETPDRLVRYQLAQDEGEPAADANRDVWIRCPANSYHARRPLP
jgi:hypothetical protein